MKCFALFSNIKIKAYSCFDNLNDSNAVPFFLIQHIIWTHPGLWDESTVTSGSARWISCTACTAYMLMYSLYRLHAKTMNSRCRKLTVSLAYDGAEGVHKRAVTKTKGTH